MESSLPSEIWTLIIAYLPRRSLRNVKCVSRTFSALCTVVCKHILDLKLTVGGERGFERLQYLNRQITAAQNCPTDIQELCIVSSMNLRFSNPPFKDHHRRNARSYFFSRKEKMNTIKGCDRKGQEVQSFQTGLLTLVPQLTEITQLSIVDPTPWDQTHERWLPYCRKALEIHSHRLTRLFLQLKSFRVFGIEDSINCPRLPELRIVNIHLLDAYNFEDFTCRLLSCSPALEEVNYNITITQPFYAEHPNLDEYKHAHPRLRSFKWTCTTGYGSPQRLRLHYRPFSPLPTSEVTQLSCIHFNPWPYGVNLSSLNVNGLTELKLNFIYQSFDEIPEFHSLLKCVKRLETLEVVGYKTERAGIHGIHNYLKRMHLEINPSEFLQVLNVVSTQAPNLEKFVLVISHEGLEADLKRDLEDLVSQFDGFNLNLFSMWSLWDFGIVVTQNRVDWTLWKFADALKAIARTLPKLRSFYGTGRLELYEGIEKDIEDDWVGAFCDPPNMD
ncbi:hypothetical protein DL96DRAFT_1681701 [Flagelloscypha sp. PMI_526]|nr:hypothetical protein DL96DRAFT_1681701 [Flagelloscypha sp. PMI_526]